MDDDRITLRNIMIFFRNLINRLVILSVCLLIILIIGNLAIYVEKYSELLALPIWGIGILVFYGYLCWRISLHIDGDYIKIFYNRFKNNLKSKKIKNSDI